MLNSYSHGARDSAGNKSTTFLANSPIYARTICRWRRLPPLRGTFVRAALVAWFVGRLHLGQAIWNENF